MSSKQISSSFIADVFFHLVQVVVDPGGGAHHLEAVFLVKAQRSRVLLGAGQPQDFPVQGAQNADGLAQELDPHVVPPVLGGEVQKGDEPAGAVRVHLDQTGRTLALHADLDALGILLPDLLRLCQDL